MNSKTTFEKQNLPYQPEPNTAHPTVTIQGNDLKLTFPIFNSDQEGVVIFKECLTYRIGDPNDEGFYGFGSDPRIKNDSLYSMNNFPNLEFGYFYKVIGQDWRSGLVGEGVVVVDPDFKDKQDFSHFLFFMKDGTFECIAKDYMVIE